MFATGKMVQSGSIPAIAVSSAVGEEGVHSSAAMRARPFRITSLSVPLSRRQACSPPCLAHPA